MVSAERADVFVDAAFDANRKTALSRNVETGTGSVGSLVERRLPCAGLKMARFGGYVEPVVVAAVHVAHGRLGELGGREIIERSERDRHEVAADLRDVAVRVDPDAA